MHSKFALRPQVDIQSPTLRLGKKKEEDRNHRAKI